MEIVSTILYIILCLALFSFAIAIHEFGHFIVALWCGLKVERFSIGFGPAIVKKTWRGVEYRLSWIPLGGYVAIPDVDPEGTAKLEGGKSEIDKSKIDKSTNRQIDKSIISPWKELAVAVAGPMMNVVLAVVLAVILALVPGARFGVMTTEIGGMEKGGPAETAGVKPGDIVVSVGGRPVATWDQMQTEVQFTDGKPTEFGILREVEAEDGTVSTNALTLIVTPERHEATGALLIKAYSLPSRSVAWMPSRNPLRQLAWDAGSIFRVLKGLVTPKEMKATGKALGGPVMIAESIYTTVRHNFWDGIGFLRFLNINLAILNLLPIPVLDGGLIFFALIAIVFRRRVPEAVVSKLSTGFMYLLIAAMAILIFRDAQRSYRIHTYKPDAAAESPTEGAIETEGGADGDAK